MSKKTIISIILTFSSLVFLIGTIAFISVDRINKKERKHLLEKGVKTTAIIKSKSRKVNRKISPQTFNWHYTDDYFVTYSFQQDSVARSNKEKSLGDYINNANKPKANPEDQVIRTSLIDKPLYETIGIGSRIEVVYIYGIPNSAFILNSQGKVTIPNLFLIACIAAILFLSNTMMLFYFIRTGKTF